MNRRTFLALAGVGALQGLAQSRKRPNFLILMADQHSPHVLGCTGDPVVRTPNLDGLAERGVLFENAYCASPLCVPSRYSFLSGRQPSDIQVWSNADSLPWDAATFAHSLGAAGYETALIGRMHFLGPDQHHGFEKRLVGDLIPAYANGTIPLTPELLAGARGASRSAVTNAGPGSTAYQAFDKDVTAATIDYLEQSTSLDRPFCAVAGFVLPHSPFVCSPEDFDYYRDRVTAPEPPPEYFEHLHPAVTAWRNQRGVPEVTREEVRRARAGYYGLVTELDRHVGRILGKLRQTGLDRDTVVIYTSDHGEMAGENGMWWKMNFYEGAVGVPLVASCPSRFVSGRRVENVVSLIDIAPTLTELAGAEPVPQASGRSLAPFLRGKSPDWKDVAFAELPQIGDVPAARMVRSGRWKLVHYHGMRPQLFDLEQDPREQNDLGADERHREIRERLLAQVLQNWSAEEIADVRAQRDKHRALIGKWAREANPPLPQSWEAPADSNRFSGP